MGNKDSRSGGKYSGNHTTMSPFAALVSDLAEECPEVIRISPGFLKAGLKSVNGNRRVKITDKSGAVLLSIRDNASHQEVTVYGSDLQAIKLWIASKCRDEGINIAFRHEN